MPTSATFVERFKAEFPQADAPEGSILQPLDRQAAALWEVATVAPRSANPLHVEALTTGLVAELERCLDLRATAQRLGSMFTEEQLDHELARSADERRSNELNHEKASALRDRIVADQSELKVTDLAVEATAASTTSVKELRDKLVLEEEEHLKRRKAFRDLVHLRTQLEGGPHNYKDRFSAVRGRFDERFESALRMAVALGDGLRTVYGPLEEFDISTPGTYGFLDDLSEWAIQASNKLDELKRGEADCTILLPFNTTFSVAGETTEHSVIEPGQFSGAIADGRLSFKIPQALGDAYGNLRMRGFSVSLRRDDADEPELWQLQLRAPSQQVASQWNQTGYSLAMPPITFAASTGSRVAHGPFGESALYNAIIDSESEWELRLGYRGSRGHKPAEFLNDIVLHLHLVSTDS